MISLLWDNTAAAADIEVDGNIVTNEGLATALLISLGTHGRAADSDILPSNDTNRMGWWGDTFAQVTGDKIGSKLWLKGRSKLTDADIAELAILAEQSVQWMVQDKVAKSAIAEAERYDTDGVKITVTLIKPDGTEFKWSNAWEDLSDGL